MAGDSPNVLLLGKPTLFVSGEPVSLAAKQMALIARIYAVSPYCVRREELARLLWPTSGVASARHSVSQALYIIKRQAPQLLRPEADRICSGRIYCDVVEFAEAVDRRDWLLASELYRGPFLDDLTIQGCVDYSHWADALREGLTRRAEFVVQKLVQTFDWESLERLTRALVRQGRDGPQLIAAHVTALYHTHGKSAAVEFIGQLPPDTTREARDTLSNLTHGDKRLGTGSPFIGRVSSLQRLTEIFEAREGTQPSVVLITGEPGVGKTALANRYYRLLAIRGARVLVASAHEAEQNVPLGVVEQWLRDISKRDLKRFTAKPWMAVIEHAFPAIRDDHTPEYGTTVGDTGYHRLAESLRRLFVELGSDKTLILGIDDLHHADSASLGLLHYLLRRETAGLSVVIGTVSTESGAEPSWLTEWESAEVIALKGLTVNEIEKWLHSLGTLEPESKESAQSLHHSTAGNPLLVSALLEEGDSLNASLAPPQSIIDFYRPRIVGRSPAAQRLLASISLVAEPGAVTTLSRITGLTDSEFIQATSELQELNWINIQDDKLALRHGLLGRVAISLLSALEEKRLHGRAARVLAEEGRSPDAMVAISYDVAGNRPDAFEASMSAVRACDVLHARSEKEFFLKLALSNAPSRMDEANVRIELAELYSQQQKLHEALDIVDPEAFSDMLPEVRKRAEVSRLKVLAEMTGDATVLKDLWVRLQELDSELPVLTATSAYTEIVGVAYDLGLDSMAAEVANQIVNGVSKVPLTISSALHLLRGIAVSGLLNGFEAALHRLDGLPNPNSATPTYQAAFFATKGTILVASGALQEAEELFGRSLGIIERFALFDSFYTINNNLGVCLMEQGRYDEARQHFATAIEYAKADVSPSRHSTARDNLSILAYEQAMFLNISETGITRPEASQVSGVRSIMNLHAIFGLSSLQLGNLSHCREAEREIRLLLQRHDQFSNDMSYVHTFMARMAALRGEVSAALQMLKNAADHYAGRNLLVRNRLELERCRLLVWNHQDCRTEIERIAKDLKPTGAAPLTARAQGLMDRAHHRFS